MKNQIVTTGIVLSRRDFQEADRILNLITPDHGKMSVIAKGVRRPRSKLAGGIELFSVNDVTILPGRSEMKTLVSSRLIRYYGEIVKDIHRTMLGYDLLKRFNTVTEDATEPIYFELLDKTLAGLNDLDLSVELVELWYTMQVLHVMGHMPNLKTDTEHNALVENEQYLFDFDTMAFRHHKGGPFVASHIKLLRLAYGTSRPDTLKQLTNTTDYAKNSLDLAKNILRQNA